MPDKAKQPETTRAAIKATRTGSRLFSPGGKPHEHPTNALNPRHAYGTAASQFWFELRYHFIEILVRGNQTYTLNDPASHRDLRALVQHPGIRTKEMLLFAYKKRNELNIFNEQDPSPWSNPPPPPPRGAPQFHHLNFSSFPLTPYSPETLSNFDLRRAQLIPHRFPNLKSIVINLEVCPGLAEQSFTMPEAMRIQFATVLLMQGVARDVADAMARVDESCRREWETIHGVLVKAMQYLREILDGKVGKRYVYLTRGGGGEYRPPKELEREVMGEASVDPQVVADVMMSEEGQKWLIPF
ncbi:hypothetical protein KC318_g181 [Hortaea werneckii]|nr:hypothetical protein KC334_g192 [Hortaea werneckii]KAI7027867.1 hypothetical protein KC355_g182 [Hortaea werneckii]KAI7676575.1 hypothetical protein KC318_g181 [Hortaea werneckii]